MLQLPSGGAGDAGAGESPAGPPTHPSLTLASERLALLSDGRGALHVAETGDRRQHQAWKVRSLLGGLVLFDAGVV